MFRSGLETMESFDRVLIGEVPMTNEFKNKSIKSVFCGPNSALITLDRVLIGSLIYHSF